MNFITLLFGIGLCGCACFMFRQAKEAAGNTHLVKNLATEPIRHLKPGLVLTRGRVVCDEPLKTPYTQTPAAWYRYDATQRYKRRGAAGFDERTLGSGEQTCAFKLTDSMGEVTVVGNGATVVRYPHERVLKSESGKKASIGDRIKKMKDMDAAANPATGKKPFFRKIDSEGVPLDVPDDLVELTPGSREAKNALRKYYERWVQPGDDIHVLGTAVKEDQGGMKIIKGGKHSPFLVSTNPEDIGSGSFQKRLKVSLLVGAGLAVVGVFVLLIGLGAVPAFS
jgi:hypothetical protein